MSLTKRCKNRSITDIETIQVLCKTNVKKMNFDGDGSYEETVIEKEKTKEGIKIREK